MPAQNLPDHVMSTFIAVPVQTVWDEITKIGRIQRALYNTVLETELRPGSRLRYYSPNRKRVFIVGEVVEVVPPRRFSYTYRLLMNGIEPETLVTWELSEESGGTRVRVTHSGWTSAHKAPEKVAAGWTEILALLKSDLETGRLPLKSRVVYAVLGRLLFLLPATTRTEFVNRRGL